MSRHSAAMEKAGGSEQVNTGAGARDTASRGGIAADCAQVTLRALRDVLTADDQQSIELLVAGGHAGDQESATSLDCATVERDERHSIRSRRMQQSTGGEHLQQTA